MFADAVRQHRDAVLSCCAERLWPDADAAVAAAAGVLVAARVAMADSARRPRPDRLRGWLLAIAAEACPMPGQPARIEDVNWAAVQARSAVSPAALPDFPARLASLRPWLERIVATLPEPRQRMYDLFVTRGLDSRQAARELVTTVAEVRRLRRENRQAIVRAFEVTALAAAEVAAEPPGLGAPGCRELRQLLAEAPGGDGDPHEDGRRHPVVLSAALRLTVSRHLSECRACQHRRDDCMARWAPGLLPILADAELREQAMEDARSMPGLRPPGGVPGAHRRVEPARPATKIVIGRATAAAGAGLVAALLLLAFVWPGVLRGTRAATNVSSPDRNTAVTSGADAPTVAGTVGGTPDDSHGRAARPGASGLLSTLPPATTGSPAGSAQPSVYFTVPPSTAPTSSPTQPSSPSPSSSSSRSTSPTPSASASRPAPTSSASTPTPTPSASATTPAPTTSASTPTPTPSASATTPTATTSASTPTPSASASGTPEPSPTASASASASPTLSSSTVSPSASATA